MSRIYSKLTDLIGKTPMVELQRLSEANNLCARIVVKVESFNPGGSVKDRVALGMIEDAERSGILNPGAAIIEPTSGNTGVGLAWIAALKGYECIIVMPDSMSVERQNLLRAAGAQLVLTPGTLGMSGAIAEAERLQKEIPNSVILGQFVNPSNPATHQNTTGEEIWEDTEGEVDVFVAGVGTGGTLTGVGRALKAHNTRVKIVAVEPSESKVLSGGMAGVHGIQGIGAGFIPEVYDAKVVDEVLSVGYEECLSMLRDLVHYEGLLVGISSGAAVCAALSLAKRPEMEGKTIVALLPDTGERYLSILSR